MVYTVYLVLQLGLCHIKRRWSYFNDVTSLLTKKIRLLIRNGNSLRKSKISTISWLICQYEAIIWLLIIIERQIFLNIRCQTKVYSLFEANKNFLAVISTTKSFWFVRNYQNSVSSEAATNLEFYFLAAFGKPIISFCYKNGWYEEDQWYEASWKHWYKVDETMKLNLQNESVPTQTEGPSFLNTWPTFWFSFKTSNFWWSVWKAWLNVSKLGLGIYLLRQVFWKKRISLILVCRKRCLNIEAIPWSTRPVTSNLLYLLPM